MGLEDYPPHRSGRAALLHPAPALGHGVEAPGRRCLPQAQAAAHRVGAGDLRFTSARAATLILDASKIEGTNCTYETSGQIFSCANWTSPTAPGFIALTVPGLDQYLGGIDIITELTLCSS